MKRIFLHIGLNCKITFLLRQEFSPAVSIFTLWAPIFTVITEVWPRANQAMVTNKSTVIFKVMLIDAMLITDFL